MARTLQKLLLCAALVAATPATVEAVGANPIRKVVNLLQGMEKKVQEEGEAETALFDKFICNCKTGKADLSKSIADAETKISSLPSDIEASEELLLQVKEGLKKAKTDRASAKGAVAEANSIREKEAGTFASAKAELDANINAIGKAVAAIEKGSAGAFLQTGSAQLLERFVDGKKDMDEGSRDAILSFLSGESSAPSSGEITGILKELGDDMSRSLSDATADEENQIRIFNELIAAKTKEIEATTQAVEDKTKKIGELGIQIVELKDDLSDTEKAFVEDKKFLADLDKDCAAKTAEREVVVKTRGEELLAIADTIKLMNSDEALELFKKTLPGAGSSLLQVSVSATELKQRALTVLRGAHSAAARRDRAGFALIAMGLTGKKVNFDKVLVMIDDMVSVLGDEQESDNKKKAYCEEEFDAIDDKKKALARTLSQEATAVDKAKESIATLTDEIKALSTGLKALDRSVAATGEQRQAENQEYTQMLSSNTAAKDLLGMAKQRLNKFYNPTLAFVQTTEQPPVIAMIDTLIADVDKELTEGETQEKLAQKDYEDMTADAKEKRMLDMQNLEQKGAVKADTEVVQQEHTEAHKGAKKEQDATLMYEMNLHHDCDWLMQNFQMRRTARESEIDSLKKAKDVLSGADFSFLQTLRKNLRRRSF